MTAETKFPLISGDISLDLVNTELVRHGKRQDLLTEPKHVVEWFNILRKNDVLFDEQISTHVEQWANDALPYLRNLRAFLREGYEQVADGREFSGDWLTYLQSLIKEAPFSYGLKDDNLIPVPISNSTNALTALIAYDALSLYVSNKLQSIHRCANPECVLLFIDTRGRRKWCSMKICGNRKKVTRHQQKNNKEK
ncbi:CGNR zinc finger domain-containing protein [Sediminibacillus albus]|uniref:Putative stress-induced transcription regulator n=1 Tax=Sediminibacillus albus TaxID=407036 RepID=A0A1G9BA36_9BACI|nr:CGNR zinc finger domain-containing protein [Sediminibacillus albus]SDK36377.1 Putative stress-induced transcription regulator [Sediminibacillus albus]